MNRWTKIRYGGYGVLICAPVALAVLAPVRAGSFRGPQTTPAQLALRHREGAAYARLIEAADAEFMKRHYASARRGYESIERSAFGRRFDSGLIGDRIAATYVAQGDTKTALKAYRRAEYIPPNVARSDGGIRKAQMVLIAHQAGDRLSSLRLLGEVERRDPTGPPLPATSITLADERAARNPAVFRRLGRIFGEAYHRSGATFAYDRALKLTGNDARISLEWAQILDRVFRDPVAATPVLRRAAASSDPGLQRSIRKALERSEGYEAGVRADGALFMAQNRLRKDRVERGRRSAFASSGAYDPSHPPAP